MHHAGISHSSASLRSFVFQYAGPNEGEDYASEFILHYKSSNGISQETSIGALIRLGVIASYDYADPSQMPNINLGGTDANYGEDWIDNLYTALAGGTFTITAQAIYTDPIAQHNYTDASETE